MIYGERNLPEESVMSTPRSAAQYDLPPLAKFYADAFEAWRRGYESFSKSLANGRDTAGLSNPVPSLPNPVPSYEQGTATSQKFTADFFHRFVETQMELCHFYEGRWAQYLKFPETFFACRSPAEIADRQVAFINQLLADYAAESNKLMRPFGDLTSGWIKKDERY
jgi:hypothetical protein